MSFLRRFRFSILWIFALLPIAFVAANFALPSERTLIVSGLGDATIDVLDANRGGVVRVERSNAASLDRIQSPLARVSRLAPDETLWLLPPRSWSAGLAMERDLEAQGFAPGEGYTFERRPHRWAGPVFVLILLAGALLGLVQEARRPATPPAR